MVEVSSSAIRAVEYDNVLRRLKVTFITGRTYTYYEVPKWKYRSLITASSVGTFFNENIRDQHPFSRDR